jgi:hypothetical protein
VLDNASSSSRDFRPAAGQPADQRSNSGVAGDWVGAERRNQEIRRGRRSIPVRSVNLIDFCHRVNVISALMLPAS